MTPGLRKFTFTTHVLFSLGWLGAVVAYLALAIAGVTSQRADMVRAAYLAMELIGWFVIVPASLAALLSGLVQSLGTEWGVFRHYWILAKLLLTAVGTTILLIHMAAVTRMSGIAATATLSSTDFGPLRIQLVVHAAGGLLVLLAATVLSVYKPWGRTPYGRRKLDERGEALPGTAKLPATLSGAGPGDVTEARLGAEATERAARGSSTGAPLGRYLLFGIVGLVLLLVVHHLIGGGMHRH